MENKNNSRAHIRMDVALLLKYRKLTPEECEDLDSITNNQDRDDLSPLSFSLRPFMEGEGREEELGKIDPFILNSLIDINLKLNLIISAISSEGKKNIFNRAPIEASLSEGGLGFTTMEAISEGDICALEIMLPVFPIAIIKTLGKAVRITALPEGGASIGLQFINIKEEDRDKIVHYIFKKQREWLRTNKAKSG
jgi:hypothetical protein